MGPHVENPLSCLRIRSSLLVARFSCLYTSLVLTCSTVRCPNFPFMPVFPSVTISQMVPFLLGIRLVS